VVAFFYIVNPAGHPSPSHTLIQTGGVFYLALALFAWRGGTRQYQRLTLPPEKQALVLRLWHATSLMLVVSWLVTAVTGTFALRWLGLLSLLGLVATEYVEAGAIPEEEAEKQAKRIRVGVVVFALMLLWLLTRQR